MFNFLKKQSQFTDSTSSLKEITNTEEFLSLIQQSWEKPFFLLKHSTRCPVSDWALTEFKLAAGEIGDAAHFSFLDLLAHRLVSDFITQKTEVPHESPQLFFFKEGEVKGTVSHEEVTASRIQDWLKTSHPA